MTQRAAESKYGIAIVLTKLNMQAVRVGSAQDEDEARARVRCMVDGLKANGIVADVNNTSRGFMADDVYSGFAYSITSDGPNETIVETRIRPNGRAKQEKRAA